MWGMYIYTQQRIKQADLEAKQKMLPAFNTFLNIYLNYHRFNNMNEEAKAALKQEKWKEFLEHEQNCPKKESGGILGLFKSAGGGEKVARMKFEMKYKVKDRLEQMNLTQMLRAKILNIKPDEDMSDVRIQNVKDAIQVQLLGF